MRTASSPRISVNLRESPRTLRLCVIFFPSSSLFQSPAPRALPRLACILEIAHAQFPMNLRPAYILRWLALLLAGIFAAVALFLILHDQPSDRPRQQTK